MTTLPRFAIDSERLIIAERRSENGLKFRRRYDQMRLAIEILSFLLVVGILAFILREWNWRERTADQDEQRALVANLKREAAVRAADDARQRCDEFREPRTGVLYRWCRVRIAGDS